MGLREKLRIVENKSTSSMRRRVERAKEEWADAERRIRQRMRIYPQKLRAMLASRAEQELEVDQSDTRLPIGGHVASPDPEAGSDSGKPIVSIHGRDVERDVEEEETKAS
jgi:hypothetical protein